MNNANEIIEKTLSETSASTNKKKYISPELIIYGDVPEITLKKVKGTQDWNQSSNNMGS